jgi:glycosyltransferase involved in cell wall biosynthesis
MPPPPLVDVLIPAFNAARTVEAAVRSIQRQTVSDIRIQVVDDGSTDDTGRILAALAAEDSRIDVVTTGHGGIVDALNAGLARGSARFVARQDSDDLSVPHRFATQLAYLEAHADCVAVSGMARHVDEDGCFMGSMGHLPSPDQASAARLPAREPYLPHPFLMTYRASLDAVGNYRHASYAEDADLCWRLQELGRLHNLDDVLGDYRLHERSITGSSVLNGRVSALSSQLAALSAARRRSGRSDIDFPKAALAECLAAGNLAAMFRIGCRQLDPHEAEWLRPALAAKLLDLAAYRPYELEAGDCRFIRDAFRHGLGLAEPENRRQLERMWSGAAARLASAGRIAEARALASPRLVPAILARLGYRLLVNVALRQTLRRARGQKVYYK